MTITLSDVPSGARVSLDGATVDETVLHLRRSSELRELKVALAGHRTWRRMVAPDRDREYVVRLELLVTAPPVTTPAPASSTHGRGAHPRPAPAPAPSSPTKVESVPAPAPSSPTKARPTPVSPRGDPAFDSQFPATSREEPR